MKISTGKNRFTKRWKSENLSFQQLVDRLRSPIVTDEDFKTYQSLSKTDQEAIKDVGGYVCGELKDGKRSKETVLNRSAVTIDLDTIPNEKTLDYIRDIISQQNFIYCLHSTRSSTKEHPRIRLIYELERPVSPDEGEFITRELCKEIGLEYCDKTTAQPERIMFYPSVSSDMKDQYIFDAGGSKAIHPEDFLNRVEDWTDRSTWTLFPDERPKLQDTTGQALKDPREKEGVIGRFCKAYPIPEAIETFLPGIYEPTEDPERFTYTAGSSAKGGVVYGRAEYGEDLFFYSFHATDPWGYELHNAFDLVRLYKFGDTKQSLKEMISLASADEKVKALKAREGLEDFENIEDQDQLLTLRRQLSCNKNGEYETTINNLRLILLEDPNLKDKYYYDQFLERSMVIGALPWSQNTTDLPRDWTDNDDAGLNLYLETNYQARWGQRNYEFGFRTAFQETARHPIRDYLESLEWDGVERIDTLLVDYFGAEDSPYTRAVTRKSLVAAVARIFEPGVKYDTMLILKGDQGVGKSTFLRQLGKDWFTDSIVDFGSKEGYQTIQGNWIIEIGELSGFYKKEDEQIKSFLSSTADVYRAAYSRHTVRRPRQCVFFGTTNKDTFLRDPTGGRRFWPVELGVTESTKDVFKDLELEVDQLWAEAYFIYSIIGEKLFLTPELETVANEQRERRMDEDPKKGVIVEFLKQEIPIDWKERKLEERELYWNGAPDEMEKEQRRYVCPLEIACEAFNRPKGFVGRRESNEIKEVLRSIKGLKELTKATRDFGKEYGKQRGFELTSDFFKNY